MGTVTAYPVSDFHKIIGISRDGVHRRVRAGHALPEPGVRIGRKEGWTREQILQWDKDFREKVS